MTEVIAGEDLANGVRIDYIDKTNRYYGDYHRVTIEISLSFATDNYETKHKFQELSRMGVAGADVEAVKSRLIATFRDGPMPYMNKEEFPDRFKLTLKKRKSVLLPGLK
ncbi:MAG: hypothetical protein B6I36_03875 [Desulfobacteraceae bacterium 4572_35.1]|nr:MAG: hypothetical protein B6I36_03875 [Desulfobacteraceae bacterium 4572_35.1]